VTNHARDAPQFYLTSPTPCAYLPDQYERKVFTHLVGKRAPELNDLLSNNGFRRSQTIAYRPACEGCRACISVRVIVDEFKPSRNMRRVWDKNADIMRKMVLAKPNTEQYSLFRGYLDARHGDGGMADMTVLDYAMMVEDSHVETRQVEYRKGQNGSLIAGSLIAVCLTDVLSDGLSMIYSFFEPDETARSLGTYMILDHIEQARSLGLPYLYLGYWVHGSPKMDYKARFLPQQRLMNEGWLRVE
jgi:leucyl-tRNA---protein transferase